MTRLYIDIETRSSVDLRSANVYSYVEDPDFTILMVAYAVDDGPVQLVTDPLDIEMIPGLWDPEVQKWAHNAQFERICFSRFRGYPAGTYIPPDEWEDSMALAAVWGYPRSLESLAAALGAEEKDSAGTRLINKFCKPTRDGGYNEPDDYPDDWDRFKDYCVQDVESLRDIAMKLPDWPTRAEQRIYLVDQLINDRGIAVDVPMAQAAVQASEDNQMEQELEITELTGVTNPNSTQQLLQWLQDSGLEIENLQAKTVAGLLEDDSLGETQRRVLELRREIALTTSKKYTAALDKVSEDHRLRGSFQYHGAHTGRWAGRGVQLQNLASVSFESENDIESIVDRLKGRRGATAAELKSVVRSMFLGPMTVVDYSAIEARVVAWLAGEDWALDAFETGRDIYVETAERMGGLTRKEGKVAVLALGYQGGVGSLNAMGAEGDELHKRFLVEQWRTANPNICRLWHEMEEAFRAGNTRVGEHIRIHKDGRHRYMELPSGRMLCYRNLSAAWKTTSWGSKIKQVTFEDFRNPGGRVDTYGGRLVENATQAVARDILAEALVRLEDSGAEVLGHVHDEILVGGDHTVKEIERLMTRSPSWSTGLPISAEGFVAGRYRKELK